MEDQTFGEVELVQREVGDDGAVVFKRRDDEPYRAFVQKLIAAGPGIEARVMVLTGEPRGRNVKQGKGRGQNEYAEGKAFQAAANELGVGLKVAPRHQTDGQTMLRMMVTAKREFTAEQVANRILGQNKMRLQQYRLKLATAKSQGNATAAAELEGKIADVEAKIASANKPAEKPANKTAK